MYEYLLIILVIIVIALFYVKTRDGDDVSAAEDEADAEPMHVGVHHGVGCKCITCIRRDYPEMQMHGETAAFFAGSAATAETMADASTDCPVDYAVNEFGTPGNDFKDWVMSQAVGPDVRKNHAEFVKDRLRNQSQSITGFPMALGELEGDDSDWIGIRGRPQKVPVTGLMAQVPDFNPNQYTDKQRLRW